MKQWYYLDSQQRQHGPFSPTQLVIAFHQGELQLTDLVWHQGLPQWLPLQHVADELGGLPEPATGWNLFKHYAGLCMCVFVAAFFLFILVSGEAEHISRLLIIGIIVFSLVGIPIFWSEIKKLKQQRQYIQNLLREGIK